MPSGRYPTEEDDDESFVEDWGRRMHNTWKMPSGRYPHGRRRRRIFRRRLWKKDAQPLEYGRRRRRYFRRRLPRRFGKKDARGSE